MNILLVSPPYFISRGTPVSRTGATLPPLGLLYLAGYIRERHPEIDIQVLDSPAYKLRHEGFRERLKDFSPDVVGIITYTTTLPTVLKTAEIIKDVFPDCTLVAGGPHPSILPEECLNSPAIDIAVLGEGEEVFRYLIECIIEKGNLSKVPNIVYKENGNIARSFTERKAADLNKLPYPARDLLDMSLYRPGYGTFRRVPSFNMITSRGCPFQCNFCQKNIFGSTYRAQSAEKTIGEIESLIQKYGVRDIIFSDDIFTFDKRNTEKLCNLLIERRIDLTWSCSTRVNLVNRHLLEKMRKSGCLNICYGIEAGNPDTLRKINKGFSLAMAKEAVRWTKEAGIETRAAYMLGFPGETRAALEQTLDAALEMDADLAIFNIVSPMPGTALYEEAKAGDLLLYQGLELYKRKDGPNPQIRLADMSEDDLVAFYRRAYKKYYLRPRYILKQLAKIRSVYDIKRNIAGFSNFLGWAHKVSGPWGRRLNKEAGQFENKE